MTLLSVSPRERILKIAQKIPASAQILSQLGRLLMDVNSGLDDIAVLLRRDSTLSARILRVSNSVAYTASERIASIEEAVNRVGFSEVYRFCGLAAASQVFDQDLKVYGITKNVLRTNSLYTALAAENLGKRLGLDAQTVYSAGLMRLTGKIVLDQLARESTAGGTFLDSGQSSVIAWEGTVFGMSNAAVAAMILDEWKFPAGVVAPVRDQYQPQDSEPEFQRASLVVNVAAGLAVKAGYGMPGEATDFEPNAAKLTALGVTQETLDACAEDAKGALKKVLEGMK